MGNRIIIYKSPIDETPEKLVTFLNTNSKNRSLLFQVPQEIDSVAKTTSVYARIVEDSRLREIIVREQLESSHATAFLGIWIKHPKDCIGKPAKRLEDFVRNSFPQIETVAIVCYWNPDRSDTRGFVINELTNS